MKTKSIFLGLILSVCGNAYAQQMPYSSQYILNPFILNPAVAGIENYWDTKISSRAQWAGIEGAPVTTYVTLHGPLKRSPWPRQTATSFNTRNNPIGKQAWRKFIASPSYAGMGLSIINEKVGALNWLSISGTFAYHLRVTKRSKISLGLSPGVRSVTLNSNKLDFNNPTVDPAVYGRGNLNQLKPDITAGVWFYSARFFAGIAARDLFTKPITFGNGTDYNQGQSGQFIISMGYKVPLNDKITFLPSTVINYQSSMPVGVDLNMKFQYTDIIWAGISYQHPRQYTGMIGFNINSVFNLGYSYGGGQSGLNYYSSGTHEFVLGILLGNFYEEVNTNRFW